uniref:OSJNBa0029C04.1 protein n=1 Tax=Oryza sativa subsp. japonica TaxID=39947 RepID=Q7XNC6_ORYSJ|nr:OSJNBa0029C04.1 [Oryza sativa Japonica Group]
MFASVRCTRDSDAKQLACGSELTTILWILNEHAGVFRIHRDGNNNKPQEWIGNRCTLTGGPKSLLTACIIFLRVAEANKQKGLICCPCNKCKNQKEYSASRTIHFHLFESGFMPSYNCWTSHGEQGVEMEEDEVEDDNIPDFAQYAGFEGNQTGEEDIDADYNDVADDLGQMLQDAKKDCESEKGAHKLDKMLEDHRTSLYPGCEQGHNKLDTTLEFLQWKAKNGISDKAFGDLLKLVKNILPEGNKLPETTYEAKKIVCPLGLEVQKIHACPNDCILYHGEEYDSLEACPVCKALRYKIRGDDPGEVDGQLTKKRIPAKVMWYFPIIPRLRRLFRNKGNARMMRWHAEERQQDGMLRHPADANHPVQKKGKHFEHTVDHRTKPKHRSGKTVFAMVKDLKVVFGKGPGSQPIESEDGHAAMWKKNSIFWELPNWEFLDIRHAIDVMHLTKNLCVNLLGFLGVYGKSKDTLEARNNLKHMEQRGDLHPEPEEKGSHYLSPASYTLGKAEKESMFQCLEGIKVPSGYSTNIKRIIRMKEKKFTNLKSHDYHVLMTQLLPVIIRGILPDNVRATIKKLCSFMNAISQKVIDPDRLEALQNDVVQCLVSFELIFPPSFFNIMTHLLCHLVNEIGILGPVFLHNMFPFERYMGVLKKYVRNRARPEASIAKGYGTEEVIEFYVEFIEDLRPIGVPESRHEGRLQGKGTLGRKAIMTTRSRQAPPPASTRATKKAKVDTTKNKEPPYGCSQEELDAYVAGEVKRQLKPRSPEKKIPIDPSVKNFFKGMSTANKEALKQSDYDRTLRKAYYRKSKPVPQLGEQPHQVVEPLVTGEDFGITDFISDTGLTMAQLVGGAPIPKAEVAYKFELGKPLVRPEQLQSLPTQMYKFHEWYIEISANGREMFGAKIRNPDFLQGEDVLWIHFKDVFDLYHRDALDVSLLSAWIL